MLSTFAIIVLQISLLGKLIQGQDEVEQETYCNLPTSVPKGEVVIIGENGEVQDVTTEEVPTDTKIRLVCYNEFEVIGSSESTCTVFGIFSPRLGRCVAPAKGSAASRTAKTLPTTTPVPPPRGRTVCKLPEQRYIPNLAEGFVFPRGGDPRNNEIWVVPGTLIRLTCSEGYWAKFGRYESVCMENGNWSNGGVGWCLKNNLWNTARKVKDRSLVVGNIPDTDPVDTSDCPSISASASTYLDTFGRNMLLKGAACGVKPVVERSLTIASPNTTSGSKDRKDNALHLAAYFGQLDIVKYLVERYPYLLETRNQDGDTPLLRAVYNNQTEAVKYLLSKGAKVETPGYFGRTALLQAFGNTQLIETLLTKYSANINARSNASDSSGTVLHLNARFNYLGSVKFLVKRSRSLITVTDNHNNTAVCVAAKNGALDVLEYLISENANLETPCSGGGTPLLEAAISGRVDVVDLLVRGGANIGAVGGVRDAMDNAFTSAAYYGQVDVLDYLLDGRPQFLESRNMNNDTPLCRAADTNQLDVIKLLLRLGAKIEAKCQLERTPLLVAAARGNVEAFKLLLDKKAKLFAKSGPKDSGGYAIHLAAFTGRADMIDFLCIEKSVLLCRADDNGDIAITGAVYHNRTAVLKQLLECGADTENRDMRNMTALHMAAMMGNLYHLALLENYTANMNAKTGRTMFFEGNALHVAVLSGKAPVVAYLLSKYPALATDTTFDGKTPCRVAKEYCPQAATCAAPWNSIKRLFDKTPTGC